MVEAGRLQRDLGPHVIAEMNFFDTYIDPPLSVARMLNLVSDLLPESLTVSSLQLERQGRELLLVIDGVSESQSSDSKLIEIQNYANSLKEELMKFLELSTDRGKLPEGQKIKTEVTTTSKHKGRSQRLVTQFKAILATGGFQDQ